MFFGRTYSHNRLGSFSFPPAIDCRCPVLNNRSNYLSEGKRVESGFVIFSDEICTEYKPVYRFYKICRTFGELVQSWIFVWFRESNRIAERWIGLEKSHNGGKESDAEYNPPDSQSVSSPKERYPTDYSNIVFYFNQVVLVLYLEPYPFQRVYLFKIKVIRRRMNDF